MKYVYIIESGAANEHYYVGVTSDLRDRLRRHNAGEVSHTAKRLPWSLKTYVAFSNDARAFQFEKYLKSGSGRAFAQRHL
jgi:putative endonuclease